MSKKIQIEFADDVYDKLVMLKEKYEKQSIASIIKDSLKLYFWYMEQEAQGFKVYSIKKGKGADIIKDIKL